MIFIDRLRHFGGGVLRGADAYWADMADDVDAWLHYHVEHRNGVPTICITGRCAECRWPELLGELEERIYVATGEVAGLREENPPALSGCAGILNSSPAVHPGKARPIH